MTLSAIPLHRLVQFPRSNARRTGRRAALGELVSSIRTHCLRQNLNVRPITGGRLEVFAGGRRLLALKQLARDRGGRYLRTRILLLGSATWAALMG